MEETRRADLALLQLVEEGLALLGLLPRRAQRLSATLLRLRSSSMRPWPRSLADERLQVADPAQVHSGRAKTTEADVDDQTALDHFDDRA